MLIDKGLLVFIQELLKTQGRKKQRYLYDLVNTYLYKDILTFDSVRKPKKVIGLLSLLALQICRSRLAQRLDPQL